MGRWEEGWWDLRTGVKGRRSSWIGGSEELVFSSENKLGGSGSLVGLSRKEKGDFGVSPKLKASSISVFTNGEQCLWYRGVVVATRVWFGTRKGYPRACVCLLRWVILKGE